MICFVEGCLVCEACSGVFEIFFFGLRRLVEKRRFNVLFLVSDKGKTKKLALQKVVEEDEQRNLVKMKERREGTI